MGTRSIIRVEGEKEGIYCHWDGYPSHNGAILLRYFKTKRKAKKLLNLGNISSLCKRIIPSKNHDFDSPQKNVTVAYHRDRGEDFSMSENFGWIDYVYELRKGKWYVDLGEGVGFELLTQKIIDESV